MLIYFESSIFEINIDVKKIFIDKIQCICYHKNVKVIQSSKCELKRYYVEGFVIKLVRVVDDSALFFLIR